MGPISCRLTSIHWCAPLTYAYIVVLCHFYKPNSPHTYFEPIGNLPTEKVTKRDLFRTFHKHGRLAQVSIKQAYGFVQFLDTSSCASALRHEQGASVRGRKMRTLPHILYPGFHPKDRILIPIKLQTLKFQSPREIPDHLHQLKPTHHVEPLADLVLRIMVVLCLLVGVGAPRSAGAGVTLPSVGSTAEEIHVNVIMNIQLADPHPRRDIGLVMTTAHIIVSVHARRQEDIALAHALPHQ